MGKRRGNGEGTIYPMPNGRFRAQVTVGGKRLSKISRSRKEVQDWLRKTLDQVDEGLTYSSARTEYGEFLKAWLANKSTELRDSTNQSYEITARLYIYPYIGKTRMKDINPKLLQKLVDKLVEKEVGLRTIQMVHAVLRSSLNQALKLGIVPRNPALPLIVPKVHTKEMTSWNESQVSQFLVSVKGHKHEVLYTLALATGMRQGELLGLEWKDIDWIGKSILVSRQAYEVKGGGFQFTAPKTRKGTRMIDLGDNIVARLREQMELVDLMRKFAGDKWKEHDLVFPSLVGTPISRWNLSAEFKELIKSAGVPPIRFHDMRHTAASLMLNNGVPVIIVSRRLGHSTAAMTLDIYGHLIPGMQSNAADLMDRLTTPVRVDRSS